MSDAPAKRTADEPIRIALAATDRAGQLRALDALIARTYPGPQSMVAFQTLAATGGAGPRLALEFVARMPDPLPRGVLLLAAQQLPDRAHPLPLRLAVAGKLLTSLPDTAQAVGPIVRSLTVGLSRSRTLERMLQLQSRVDRCAALDEMVRTTETRVKLKCPKCRAKLTRPELVVHLWFQHRLIFERGQALDPRSVVEKIVESAAARSPTPPEESFRATAHYFPDSEPLQVLQAVAARQRSTGSIPRPLVDAATESGRTLCPTCLASRPDRILPLPPPLETTPTRIAGDGYSVSVQETSSSQLVEIRTPESARTILPGTRRLFGPRGWGVLVALPFFALFVLAVWVVPFRVASPFGLAVLLAIIGWGLDIAVRLTRPGMPAPGVRGFDVVWEEIAANLSPTDATARFLTRLCLSSYGRGTPGERSATLRNLIETTAARADGSAAFVQLGAAADALQAADATDLGKDRVNRLAKLFDAFWHGERTAEYAEYLAEIAAARMVLASGEARRLALLMMASAFESGLLPQDLLAMFPYLPWLRMAMGMPTPARLQMACAVWRGKNSEPWSNAGPAVTLFELAKKFPAASRKLLVSCPDALLKLTLPDAVQRTLGDVLLTPRGLVLGSALLTDPAIAIDLGRSPRGSGWILQLGREFINLDRKLPGEMIPVFSAWLRYRVEKLLPLAETITRSNPAKVRVLLEPLASVCALCGAESIGRIGKLGDPWPLERRT